MKNENNPLLIIYGITIALIAIFQTVLFIEHLSLTKEHLRLTNKIKQSELWNSEGIITKNLTIIDEKFQPRMLLTAVNNGSGISFLDPNNISLMIITNGGIIIEDKKYKRITNLLPGLLDVSCNKGGRFMLLTDQEQAYYSIRHGDKHQRDEMMTENGYDIEMGNLGDEK